MYNIITIAVVIILVILYITVLYTIRHYENTLLTGAWSGSVDFCTESNLRKLFLYIFANDGMFSHSREAYLIMESDNNVLIDQLVRINFSSNFTLYPSIEKERKYFVDIDYLDKEEPEFLPNDLTLYYYPHVGKLIFANDDTSYMTLYKDCAASDL
jgi:hypothetical protein